MRTKTEENWHKKYEALCEYLLKNGHMPSKRRVEDRGLLNWWKYNKKCRNAGILSREKCRLLNKICPPVMEETPTGGKTKSINFDYPVRRQGTNCYKYDTMPNEDTIPLWVADMDFETAPCITAALRRRMNHGCFGYTAVPNTFYQATIDWFDRRHGWKPERQWFIHTTGVIPALSAIVKAMTQPGDKVLVQQPVYNCFFSSIRNNDCLVEDNTLQPVYQSEENSLTYTIDFDDFERRCADPLVKVFILCNPHNPAGRLWKPKELQRMGDICKRHGVFVIADEIHCEFTYNDARYTPFASVSDAPCAVCVSPSKAFNIAGLQIANIICADKSIRERIDRAININETCDVNPFGVIALQAAYTPEGEHWLQKLNEYIYSNYLYVRHFINDHFPTLRVGKLEATYLMWIDVSPLGIDGDQAVQRLLHNANIFVSAGSHYGEPGRNFIRVNLATQRLRLEEAAQRILQCKQQ